MPTYCTSGDECGGFGSGFIAFFFGFAGMLLGGAYGCWVANPFLVVSWFFIKRKPLVATILSGIAIGIGLWFTTYTEIMGDEGGNYDEITGYAMGYWFWLSSMVAVFLGSLWLLLVHKKKTT
jgi:hypothetical protein